MNERETNPASLTKREKKPQEHANTYFLMTQCLGLYSILELISL